MDSILYFLDRIHRIDGIFFACGERPIIGEMLNVKCETKKES